MNNDNDKRDGLGDPIDPAGDYYIQDSRSYVGNCMSFWRPNGAGYACSLDDIGIYKGDKLPQRETDIPWPVNFIKENTVTHVNIDRIRQKLIQLVKETR